MKWIDITRDGFAGAAFLTWVVAWFEYARFARRNQQSSPTYPIELSDHGDPFHVSVTEAWSLAGLAMLAVAFFGVAVLVNRRRRNSHCGEPQP